MNTRKVLKRLKRMAEKDSLPSIGPVKEKIIAYVIQNYKPRRILDLWIFYNTGW